MKYNQTVKTREQLATEYGISRRTLHRWLKKADIAVTSRTLLTPKDQELIYKEFGKPS